MVKCVYRHTERTYNFGASHCTIYYMYKAFVRPMEGNLPTFKILTFPSTKPHVKKCVADMVLRHE